jgi:hypothetical protein
MIPFNMLARTGTLRYLAYYRNHQVKFFYAEGQEKPWRFEFERGLEISSDPKAILKWDDPPELNLDSAKAAALVYARRRYGGPVEENWDDWIDISRGE